MNTSANLPSTKEIISRKETRQRNTHSRNIPLQGSKIPLLQSTGDSSSTQCKMSCIRDYIAVESSPYTCTKPPCRKWELQDSHCFMCDKKCSELGDPHDPNPRDLIKILGCKCDQIMVTSDGNAAIWQNKRTGLFFFYGEHNERPVYRNNGVIPGCEAGFFLPVWNLTQIQIFV